MLANVDHTQPGPHGPFPVAYEVMARTLVGMHPHGLGNVEAFQNHVALT